MNQKKLLENQKLCGIAVGLWSKKIFILKLYSETSIKCILWKLNAGKSKRENFLLPNRVRGKNKIRAELLCFIEACTLRGKLSGKRGHSMLSKVGWTGSWENVYDFVEKRRLDQDKVCVQA